MYRPCQNISDDETCNLDAEVCEKDCPLFESEVEQVKHHTECAYRYWDYQIAKAKEPSHD